MQTEAANNCSLNVKCRQGAKLMQNENCRLKVKGRPGIKCTHCAILTFERPHSSNYHVAYITNTRVYVIIEIICLCLN